MKRSFSTTLTIVAFTAVLAAAVYLYFDNRRLRERLDGRHGLYTAAVDCPNPCTGKINWVRLRDAVRMISEYGENQAPGINTRMTSKLQTIGLADNNFTDSRFVTFSMDTIKNFICTVDKMLDEYKPLNANGNPIKTCDLGIKFYFAAYPGLSSSEDLKKTYKGRHTLLLVPTYLNSATGIYTEFFPSAIDKKTKFPLSLARIMSIENADSLAYYSIESLQLITFSYSQEIGKNHGGMCPPPDICPAELLSMSR